jgi:DNA-binding winged helix-turn-helix (wHTH) protein/TolB-like protein/Tfp pilus assembly protein PilF
MSRKARHLYEFGPFRLDTTEHQLLRGEEPVPLTPKAFDILLVLVQNSGHLLHRDDLMSQVWPDTVVEENNLTQNISALRKALGEDADQHQYIETVPRRGYRFVADVKEMADESVLIVGTHTRSRIVIEEEETSSEDKEEIEQVAQKSHLTTRGWKQQIMSSRPGLVFIAACLVVAGVIVLVYSYRQKPYAGGLGIRSIAVLPFKPMSQEASDEYLAQGVADSLITRLSNVKGVMVRPTSAVLKYGASEVDPVAAGRELGVDALLDGSIQKIGDRIRVTVQLLRTSDGTPIWAYKCDQRCTNVFEIQDSISEKTVSALLLKLTNEERNLIAKRPTQNQEAYEAYVKGRYFWNKRTPDDLKKAADYFQEALDIDPTYALAYSGLADTFSYRGYAFGRLPPREAMPRAKEAAEQAVKLDDSLAEAHASLALARFLDWDFASAEGEFERSIELNPNYPSVHHFYAVYLAEVLGRSDDALAEAYKGLELDPMSLPINNMVALLNFQAHRWDAALQQFQRLGELFPNYNVHGNLSDCYKYKGMEKEAAEELLKGFKASGMSESKLEAYRHTFAASGWRGMARKSVEEDVAEWKRDPWHTSAFGIATHYAELGENEQALQWLGKVYEAHSGMLIWLKTQPQLDGLRSDPRFQDLIMHVGSR